MPRFARQDVLYSGCCAHIISRSIRKMKLFNDDDDFYEFYKLILLTKKRAGFKIYHYCFMQTHFHMAVSLADIENFSSAIRYIKSQYSYKFHS